MKNINENLLENMLCFIKKYQIEYGRSPSYRVIMKQFSISSLSVVCRYVEKLMQRNLLEKDKLGGIEISENLNCANTIIAPIVGTVTCGKPIYAQENIEGNYQLPSAIFGNNEVFMLYADGDSMQGVGIKSGDILVVRKTNSAENGQIVVALIDDSATVKTFYKKKDFIVLHPENDRYDDIILKDVKILGVVQHNIHKF